MAEGNQYRDKRGMQKMFENAEQDFKYLIQNFSNIFVGGRMTYEELADYDDTPLQLKKAIHRVIKREIPMQTMLCDHLLNLSPDSDSFLLYQQAKITIEVVFFHEVETKKEKQTKYEAKTYTFDQFLNAQELHGENKDFFIREIVFKKLRLATISV